MTPHDPAPSAQPHPDPTAGPHPTPSPACPGGSSAGPDPAPDAPDGQARRHRRHRAPDEDASELELLTHLARRLRHGSAVETGPWGVSPHQARALAVLARGARGAGDGAEGGRGVRPGRLAERLQVSPRSVTEVVDALERLGLVARSPDPSDRRAVLVAPTEEGLRVAREIRALRRQQAERTLEVLEPSERAQLRRTLEKLLAAVG